MFKSLNESVLERFAVSSDIINLARKIRKARTLLDRATKSTLKARAVDHLREAKGRLYRTLKPANTFH